MIQCSECHTVCTGTDWHCTCGSPVEVVDDSEFDVEKLEKVCSLWRYKKYLGVGNRVSFNEGMTPVVFVDDCYYKLDYLFPTNSFKDRGSTVMMSYLDTQKIKTVVEDSSGNAGASVAAYAALAGITAEIYVPDYASQGKISQIAACGAKIVRVEGTREDTRKKAVKRAQKVYYASHQWNPYFLEGMKTVAYELAEQFGWDVPTVVIPVGSGSLYYGVYKGFNHLVESGVIDEIPYLVGVQAEVFSPVYAAVNNSEPRKEKSIAEGLLVEEPPRLKEIVKVVKKYGDIITVSEEEIRIGLKKALHMGLYIEPTSAVVVAALDKMPSSEKVVGVLTGSGLKATHEIRQLLE
ncbi:MAG: pyridoxal-phosphate dependent enzyme [Candidatus Methanofastidiosia archaeon]|jgi:threonine synthase